MDRRTFLMSSLALPSFAYLPTNWEQNQQVDWLKDCGYMSFNLYMDHVGKTQALNDFRNRLFPIIDQQRMIAINESDSEVAWQCILWGYNIEQSQVHEDHSIKACCRLVNVPSKAAFRDWWLVLRTDSTKSRLHGIRVVFVSSFDTPSIASMNCWLASRITYRLHRKWNVLSQRTFDATSLTQDVNREVMSAISTMPS